MFQARSLLLIAFLFSYTLAAYALPEDKFKTIHIAADTTVYNYKTGFTVFTGHVTVDQGTTHITADRVTTKTNNQHRIQEAIAYGEQEPAHYWTEPKVNDLPVHAHAKIIKLNPISSNITLMQNVIIAQGENSFKGELIIYNRNDETIVVPASSLGRAVLVYNPDAQTNS